MAQTIELDFNPWDEAFKVNPYPHYDALLAGPPRILNLFMPVALIARYDDAVAVLCDHENFTAVKPDIPFLNDQFKIFRGAPILQTCDPPLHTRLRRVVSRSFASHRIEHMEPRIRAITSELLDSVERRGRFEVMADLANPLPMMVISEMLGIPPEDYDRFKSWCDGFVAGQNVPPGMPVPPEVEAANGALREYFAAEIEKRRRQPSDDLIGMLVAAQEQGEGLTLDETLAFIVMLLIAGNETTTNLIGNGMMALGRNPDQMARLRAQPQLMEAAVEEMLRYDPPIQVALTLPIARREMNIGGTTIPAGALMFVILAAANRDPARFAHPERFDIGRHPNPHLAFSEGIHHCAGALLARLEGKIAFSAALARFPLLGLADPNVQPPYKGSYFMRGIGSLEMTI
jgi:cytochrome P450